MPLYGIASCLATCIDLPQLDRMRWQPQLGRMGMKVEGAGKKRLFAIGSPLYQALVRPIHDWAMTVLARLRMDGTYNQTQPLQYLRGKKK